MNKTVNSEECSFNFMENVFNMVQTPNAKTGMQVIAHFLNKSLKNGKRAAFITFSNPTVTLKVFEGFGFNFNKYIENEQLFYFYYKNDFAEKLSLSQDYQSIFNEIAILGGPDIERVAFSNADLLINTQSSFLTMSSVQKMAIASGNHSFTFLGQYTDSGVSSFKDISDYSQKVLPCFYTIESGKENALVTDHSMRSHGNSRKSAFIKGKGYVRA